MLDPALLGIVLGRNEPMNEPMNEPRYCDFCVGDEGTSLYEPATHDCSLCHKGGCKDHKLTKRDCYLTAKGK
jgi:hypothetical protein